MKHPIPPNAPLYNGVLWRTNNGLWMAFLRAPAAPISLCYSHDPKEAAYAADFARYLCYGLEPKAWPHSTFPPNFPPTTYIAIPRMSIVRKLLDHKVLSVPMAQHRLAEYDAACV